MRPRLDAQTQHALAAHESVQWGGIREAALTAFDEGRCYRYHDGRVTHDCADLATLARVTRAERKRVGVRWREDG
jgi:hypothetical protein